jgi:hypothetical protein
MSEQLSLMDDNPEYKAFVDKFKPKLTTDDCYTPPIVYDAIRDWVCKKHGIDPAQIVRPFYPGGDYERFDYPNGCIVLDNPPFSILTKICTFYLDRQIPFFLFAPSLTIFSGRAIATKMNHIVCDAYITYENGANVRTAFVTNLYKDIVAQSEPDLHRIVKEANEANIRARKQELPKYAYPDEVLTAAMLQRYSKYGIEFVVRKEDCVHISALEAQRKAKKTVFGGGLLLSEKAAVEKAAVEKAAVEKAAAEKAAAEKAAAEKAMARRWELSETEKRLSASLGAKERSHE